MAHSDWRVFSPFRSTLDFGRFLLLLFALVLIGFGYLRVESIARDNRALIRHEQEITKHIQVNQKLIQANQKDIVQESVERCAVLRALISGQGNTLGGLQLPPDTPDWFKSVLVEISSNSAKNADHTREVADQFLPQDCTQPFNK